MSEVDFELALRRASPDGIDPLFFASGVKGHPKQSNFQGGKPTCLAFWVASHCGAATLRLVSSFPEAAGAVASRSREDSEVRQGFDMSSWEKSSL